MTDKQALRREVRSLFPGKERRDEESSLICRHILASDAYHACGVLCAYAALPRQADVTSVMEAALRSGKRLLLPKVEGDGIMTLRSIGDLSELVLGFRDIPEPRDDAPVACLTKDTLLLVPLEAIDKTGMRLGKGGGFYDRLLEKADCAVMGTALSHQVVERVPADPWDRPLPCCALPEGIRVF